MASADPLPASQLASEPDCIVCSGASSTVHRQCCVLCQRSVHISCLLKEFKSAGGEQLKNKLEWFRDFIDHAHLRYACNNCSAKQSSFITPVAAKSVQCTEDIANMKQSISDMGAKIADVLSNMNSLRSEIVVKLSAFTDEIQAAADPVDSVKFSQSSASDQASAGPASYASIIS